MVEGFQGLIQSVGDRLGQMAQASPFKGKNPFDGAGGAGIASPFSGIQSPFQGSQLSVQSPFNNPLGNVSPAFNGGGFNIESPFTRGAFQVGSPFGGTFNVQSPFGNTFGGTSSPFSGSPFNVQNAAQMEAASRREQSAGTTGGTSSTGGSIDYEGPATASDNAGITGEQVDAFIRAKFANSPLVGQGQALLEEANRNGISVLMLIGISWKESGMGSNVGAGNIWGITDPSRDGGRGGQRAFQKFASVREEIAAAARLLGSSTYRGKSIGEQIGAWYVGPQAYAAEGLDATDMAGNGTVREYINNFIAATYQAFGKAADPTTRPTQRAGGGARLGNAGWEAEAQKFMGIPYTNGGIRNTGNPLDGMDCSSFVGYVMGIDRNMWNAQVQYNSTRRVAQNEAQRGDLVFFAGTNPNDASAKPVSHVGIYLGNGKMIHTGGDGGVMIVDLNTAYWQKHMYGYGRLG